MTDHYDNLGVDKDATGSQIKRAWRKKASKLHPDKPGGDTEQFDLARKAYLVLSNPVSREKYDRTGEDGLDKVNRAEQFVLSLFGQLIDKYMTEGTRFNFIKLAKESITAQMEPVKKRLSAEKPMRTRLSKLRKFVDVDDENNLFAMMVSDKEKTFERVIAQAKDELQLLEDSLKIVEIYRDDFRENKGEDRMDAFAYLSTIASGRRTGSW